MPVSFAAFHAAWTQLPTEKRTAITAALGTAAATEFRRLNNFYSWSDDPTRAIEVLGVLGDQVHFLAHHYQYNNAQSGSDWADHIILAGSSSIDGTGILLRTACSRMIIEYEERHYDSVGVAEEQRDKVLMELDVEPPIPEQHL